MKTANDALVSSVDLLAAELISAAPMLPMWLYFTETSGLEAATGRATKRGAKVMNGPRWWAHRAAQELAAPGAEEEVDGRARAR